MECNSPKHVIAFYVSLCYCSKIFSIVDGNWALWYPWSECEGYCSGTRSRFRNCNNPVPSCGGNYCIAYSSRKCFVNKTGVEGEG
ncbi:HMCN1-like protein, partial [Mya arenaria]